MTTAKSEALIREKIGQQLARRSALQYDLEANQQAAANLQLLIDACDGNIRGLEQARSMMAEVEADLAKSYAEAQEAIASDVAERGKVWDVKYRDNDAESVAYRKAVEEDARAMRTTAAKPKPQKQPKAAQAPKPAKRRGRPPKAKPEPIADEPTQAGGSWNGNGGLTPEQAAAQ